MESVMETPMKRRRTETGHVSGNTYNSDDDSGDNLFDSYEYETVATVPVQRNAPPNASIRLSSPAPYITQPTQVIEKAPGTPIQTSQVQVAASSPFMSPLPSSPAKRTGGILASAMAPPGTAFRLPMGVAKAPATLKKLEVIDLSDDEGMKYQGGSSDDESQRNRRDIRPSVFVEKPLKSPSASFGNQTQGGNRFGEIISSSFYKPTPKGSTGKQGSTLSGSVFDSRNRDENNTTSRIAASKRSADAMASAYGNTTRPPKQRQTGPSKAVPIVEELDVEDIADWDYRTKVKHIMMVFPNYSVMTCYTALKKMKGHCDDAMNELMDIAKGPKEIDLTISDDEDQLALPCPAPQPSSKAPAKQQLKVPNQRIQDKYTATQRQILSPPPATKVSAAKPRRRLIQGRKRQSSPVVSSPVQPPAPAPRPYSPVSVDSDSAVEFESEADPKLENDLLSFFNTCSARDLADLAAIGEKVAIDVLSQRPFKNLNAVRQTTSGAQTTKKPARKTNTKRPIGEKIVEECEKMWSGYEAVDELVKRCEAIGKPVAEEMKKWGVDVFGASKAGELELVNFGGLREEDKTDRLFIRDSGIGTPTTSGNISTDDEAESDVKKSLALRTRTPQAFFPQPSSLAPGVTLKDYQVVGINWLSLLFGKNLSCILADDMGLGKTCQVVSFLAHLLEQGETGPHLVIVPSSTLENWLREFATFCPTLSVMPYHAGQAERAELREDIERIKPHVIVTTYGLAGQKEDNKFFRRLKPCVCVFDEGHVLKSTTAARYDQLMKIPARFRLLLTGTPLQNNLSELVALLSFILPSVFREQKEDLEAIFSHKALTSDTSGGTHLALLSEQRINRARSMMTPFILRRKKHQVLKHLPAKTRRVEYCELMPLQQEIYSASQAKARKILQDREAGIKPTGNQTANIMMELRKASMHPMLFRELYDDKTVSKMAHACLQEPENQASNLDLVYEDLCVMTDYELHYYSATHPNSMSSFALTHDEWMNSGKVQKLATLLTDFKAAGDRVLVFSQFVMVLNVLEAVMETLGMKFFRLDGSTDINDRQAMIDQFYDEPDITVFMLSTKAGGAGINLACANKVIIFDSSFNPQDDIQAENRAHRVGQTRDVEVIRLVTKGTIEEQIHRLGETKLALDSRVAGEEATEEQDVDGAKVERAARKRVEEMMLSELKREGAPAA